MHDAAIAILAGGAASRVPGKLEYPIDGEPLLARLHRRLNGAPWPIYIATSRAAVPEIASRLGVPLLFDQWPGEGPLAALFSAARSIRSERIFALAADQPDLELSVLERLAGAWQPGDEAAIPIHGERTEVLAALYARRALLREALPLLRRNERSMHALVSHLNARFVPFEERYFANVNTPADLPETARCR
jgi:molybdopterin-guanine dinucleotide biosynthesis protein A